MLSTSKVRTSSWRYYANQVSHGACEYFLGIGEAPGRWYGRGLDMLGLGGDGLVREWQLEALFGRALHPASREQLGRAWRIDGVTGYDLCFSAPKSVSALWALADDPQITKAIRQAHAAAVRTGLDYLDGHAGFSRIGRDGRTQVGTDGFAAAVFDHRTSRAGDPQIHTHALVVNKVRCPDGEWRTIDGHEIYAHKKSAGVLYQAALRNELSRRLGVSWTAVSKDGQAEIAGIPKTLTKLWSKRTDQLVADAEPMVAAYEEKLGRPLTSAERTAVAKVAVIKTRPDKEAVDIVALAERWETEAAGAGWTPQRLISAATDYAAPPTSQEAAHALIERVVADAVVAAGERKAVFSRSDVTVEVAARLPVVDLSSDMTRELVERVTDRALATTQAVELLPQRDGPQRASDARWASRTTLNRELEILAIADRGRRIGVGRCDPDIVRQATRSAGLDRAQALAVNQLTRFGDQITVLVAPAGTGKTTAMAAAVSAWRASGYQVMSLAPSARAAKELGTATGLPADTVAKFLYENGRFPIDSRYRLGPGAVLLVDEASMLGTADLHQLAGIVTAAGGQLALVGDPAQIGAIDQAGGMLPALADRLGAPSLAEVHRFRHAWERIASLQLRRGNPACIDTYLDHDRIQILDPDTDPYDAVIADYQHRAAAGSQVLMLARTHDDVDQLNQRARTWAMQTGNVRGDPLLTTDGGDWRVGDRLRVTRNDRRITVGDGDHLRNGDTFIVNGIAHDGLLVQRLESSETAVLPIGYVAEHARYGWAATIDAAQGATVDHALLLARPGLDRSRLYVGLTRGREANQLYLAAAPDPEIRGASQAAERPDPAGVVREMLAAVSDQAAAHTRLLDPTGVRATAPIRDRRREDTGREIDWHRDHARIDRSAGRSRW